MSCVPPAGTLDRWVIGLHRRVGRFASPTFILFCIVGASGVVVNMVVFVGCEWAGVPRLTTGFGSPIDPLYLSVPISYEIATLTNYALNNAVTFRDRRHEGRRAHLRALFWYNVVSLVGLIPHAAVFQLLQNTGVFSGFLSEDVRKFVNNGCGILVSFASKYYLNILITWRKDP